MCFLFLVASCRAIEVKRWRKWTFPLVLIGMNSIAAYLMAHLFERFTLDSLRIHLGTHPFSGVWDRWRAAVRGMATAGVFGNALTGCYRRKIFLRF